MLVLVLAYQPAPPPTVPWDGSPAAVLPWDIQYNPFLLAVSSFSDDGNLFHSEKSDAPTYTVSFTHLYNALASCIHEEVALLLFYSLLHRNAAFREFVFAKSDVDGLLVPMLASLYEQRELSCNRVYMVLIVLLILSQDSSFSENVHSRVHLASVPWFKEYVLNNISLGRSEIHDKVLLREGE